MQMLGSMRVKACSKESCDGPITGDKLSGPDVVWLLLLCLLTDSSDSAQRKAILPYYNRYPLAL